MSEREWAQRGNSILLVVGQLKSGLTMRMFVKKGLVLASIGCAAGLILSTALTRTLTTFLYGVAPNQVEFLVGAVVLLMAVAVAASYIPARRVRKIDPVIALRWE